MTCVWLWHQGDSNEFNQCQTQLIDLHDAGLCDFERRCEFVAYRLLYYIFNKADIDSERLMASLPNNIRASAAVSHALQAWSHCLIVRIPSVSSSLCLCVCVDVAASGTVFSSRQELCQVFSAVRYGTQHERVSHGVCQR